MKSIKGVLYALISSSTFGLIALFTLPLMRDYGMELPSILFYRFGISALVMGIIAYFANGKVKVEKDQKVPLIVLGLFYALTAMCLTLSYKYIPSGIATTIHFLYPISVSLLMIIFFKEKKSLIIFLAAIISVVGVALLCWGKEDKGVNYIGILIASVTIITYALYIVGVQQTSVRYIPAETLTFYLLSSGAIFFFVFAMCTTGIQGIPNFNAGVNVVLLALLPTVLSDFTLVLAIKYAGPTITSILGSLEPLVAVLVGVFCFSEYFNIDSAIGVALIIASVILVLLGKKNMDKEEVSQNNT